MSDSKNLGSRQPARLVKCPTCGKQAKFTPGNAYRPFCSERCKLIDLGAWAEGKYAIPATTSSNSSSSTDPSDEDQD